MSDLTARFIQPAFRGVPFFVEDSRDDFGRRIALHEFPQYDIPFAEDMGRRARRFVINAFVVGQNWERDRDKLIAACEKPESGKMTHPDLGEVNVVCESCSTVESKVFAARTCSFTLTFIETGDNRFPSGRLNTSSAIRQQGINALDQFRIIYEGTYAVTHLPQYVADSISALVDIYTTILNGFNNVNINSFLSAFTTADVSVPSEIATSTMNVIAAIKQDTVDPVFIDQDSTSTSIDGEGEQIVGTNEQEAIPDLSTLTPERAIRVYEVMHTDPLLNIQRLATIPDPLTLTPTRREQLDMVELTILYVKCLCVCESVVVASYMDFPSTQDAYAVWNPIIDRFAELVEESRDQGRDDILNQLMTMRAVFLLHIATKAPTLNFLVFKSYLVATPSLVIAYDLYEDISRDAEIVARNRIRHPGFIASDALELLNE